MTLWQPERQKCLFQSSENLYTTSLALFAFMHQWSFLCLRRCMADIKSYIHDMVTNHFSKNQRKIRESHFQGNSSLGSFSYFQSLKPDVCGCRGYKWDCGKAFSWEGENGFSNLHCRRHKWACLQVLYDPVFPWESSLREKTWFFSRSIYEGVMKHFASILFLF